MITSTFFLTFLLIVISLRALLSNQILLANIFTLQNVTEIINIQKSRANKLIQQTTASTLVKDAYKAHL